MSENTPQGAATGSTVESAVALTRRGLMVGTALAGSALAMAPLCAAARASGDALGPLSKQLPQRIYGDDAYPVWYRRLMPVDAPPARYPGFKPSTKLLKAGDIRREGAMPLPCDIIFERDVAVKLRDGTTIYTDVFRPAVPGRYPVVMAWSPYGKEIGGQWFDDVPHRSGVPLSVMSELQKFEGPDPARYCAKGYVILNPDARGAYMSEGNVNFWGRQVAEDGYDVIEWAAAQPWSSGKVAMAGNSWLAISQWFIAAARPPHLAAIAPWEGATDHYPAGGISDIAFDEIILQSFAGRNMVEDQVKMTPARQFRTPYWEDKVARVEKIDIPAYVVASYTHPAHTLGSFHGFRNIASKQKWLRVHDTNEWHDFNTPAHQDDLIRFFDHVLKGEDNGWAATPRVRLAVLNPGGQDILGRPEEAFPLARQDFRPLYLADGGRLTEAAQPASVTVSYPGVGGRALFTRTFEHGAEIVGYMKLKLWVEAQGADDMDIMVRIEKRGADGGMLRGNPNNTMGMPVAATGQLRVSMRELDAARSTPSEPVLKLERALPLKPGEIVPVEIGIWPTGLQFNPGEQLVLTVAGPRPPGGPPPFSFGGARIPLPVDGGVFPPGSNPELTVLGGPPSSKPAFVAAQTCPPLPVFNQGTQVVHFGGRYDSHLLIPFIPPRSA